MKFKSIVLIFVAFVFGVLFVVYLTSAQKSKANDETKNENQSQENLIAELRKNEVCTVLSENIMAKEAENLTISVQSVEIFPLMSIWYYKRVKKN